MEEPDVLDEPLVEDVRDEDEVLEVREVEPDASPRRVVVEEPSVLMVLVVVRALPLVLTRDVVVVDAGDTLRVLLEELLPEVVDVRDEPDVVLA